MPTTRSKRNAERYIGVRSGITISDPTRELLTESSSSAAIGEGNIVSGSPVFSSSESAVLQEIKKLREEWSLEQRRRDQEIHRELRAVEERLNRQLSTHSLASVSPVPPIPCSAPSHLPLSGDTPIQASVPLVASSVAPVLRTTKIPFDGKNWETYKIQFLALARVNGWDNTAKTSFLLNSLKEGALSVLPSLTEAQCSDFDTLFQALENRFGRLRSHQLNVVEFNSYMQSPGQSVQALAFEIERLVNLAYPSASEEMKDDLATARFLGALSNVELKRQLLLANVSGLQQTLSKAVEIELINKTFGTKSSTTTSVPVSSSSSFSSSGTSRDSRKRSFSRFSSDAKKDAVVCFECGKPGHTKAKCFKLHPELKKFHSNDSNRLGRNGKTSHVQKTKGNEGGRN